MDYQVNLSEEKRQSLHRNLLNWWSNNGRVFPWRETSNAFHILISEVLLQRTRASQVVPVYEALVWKYPSPASMGLVNIEILKQIIYSLGLPQRVNTIFKMVQQLNHEFDGIVPGAYEELRKLEGVGDYIARAVSCFGFGQSVSIIDTNTVRIIGRVFGLATDAESRRKKHIRELHDWLLDTEHSKEYNYALLDLGALICTPSNPKCTTCPLCRLCKYAESNDQQCDLET